jgi:hypothetical protein
VSAPDEEASPPPSTVAELEIQALERGLAADAYNTKRHRRMKPVVAAAIVLLRALTARLGQPRPLWPPGENPAHWRLDASYATENISLTLTGEGALALAEILQPAPPPARRRH